MCRVWRYSLIIYLSIADWLWLCVNDHCSDRWCGCVSGVSWPVAVSFDSHQLGESLTIVWKHPPCDQTNYISGYIVAYRKLTESNCDSTTPGRKCFVVHVSIYLFMILKQYLCTNLVILVTFMNILTIIYNLMAILNTENNINDEKMMMSTCCWLASFLMIFLLFLMCRTTDNLCINLVFPKYIKLFIIRRLAPARR